MTTTFQLFTSRFQAMSADLGTAVRTSNGAPRWALKYPLTHSVKETFPLWADVKAKMPHEQFAERYEAGLTKIGVDVIASRFRAIVVAEDEPRLVLLCFDDLTKPGVTCHRTVFARWWERMTGEHVTELQGAPAPTIEEPGLF